MKALFLAAACGLAAAPARAQVPAGRSITLSEAFALAVRQSESLAIAGESVAEARARSKELLAGIKPHVGITATELVQDPQSADAFSSRFNQPNRFDARLTARQTLFTGFREYLGYRAALANGDATELDRIHAEDLLYLDVARAYVGVLAAQSDILTRRTLAGILTDRIRELKARERIGRSRVSEVLAAEAQLAQAEAALEGARGLERNAQQALRFLTGLEEDLRPEDLVVLSSAPLGPFVERLPKRPDVAARLRDAEAADYLVRSQARAMWPTIAVDGNYYLKRAGIQEDVRWDALFSATMPLYAGGGLNARVAQGEARWRASRKAAELSVRQARREVLDAHESWLSDLAAFRALQKALELSKADARAQNEDYRLGLVTNLDVLSALDNLQQVQLALDARRLSAVFRRIQLEVAAGGRP